MTASTPTLPPSSRFAPGGVRTTPGRGSLIPALLAALALGVAGCGGDASEASGEENRETTPDRDEAAIHWAPQEVDVYSEGCEEGDLGCARARITWPAFEGADPASRAAAAWVEARIRERGLLEGDDSPTAEALARDFVEAYDAFIADFPGEFRPGWALEREIEVKAATPPVLLLEASEMSYTGGAHPNSWVRLHALHLASGRALDLEALLDPDDEPAVQGLVEARYRAQAGLAPGAPLTEAGLFEDRIPLVDNLEPAAEGLTFHYNPYAIGPYAMGMIRILVPWSELGPHLREQAREDLAPWLEAH
jgi:hypothetical protein